MISSDMHAQNGRKNISSIMLLITRNDIIATTEYSNKTESQKKLLEHLTIFNSLFYQNMAHVSKIKQCKHVDDNQVNQIFKADETKDYYQGQAVKIASGVVSPVTAVDDVVFGICEEDHESDTYAFNIHVRQPRM
jgi:hypothetical protein